MRSLSALLAFTFLAASPRLASAAETTKTPRVVVLGFKVSEPALEKHATALGEALLTDLSRTGRYRVIGESDVAVMLGFDRQKALLGCSDTSCLVEIGSALGCEFLLAGTLGQLGGQIRLDLKMLDLKNAAVIAREGTTVGGEGALFEAMSKTLERLLRQTGPAKGRVPTVVEQPGSGPGALPFVAMGGGAVVAVAGGFLMRSGLAFNDSKAAMTYDEAATARGDAETRLNLGGALVGVGAAAVLGGVAMLVFGGDDERPPAEGPSLSLGPDGVLFSFAGSF